MLMRQREYVALALDWITNTAPVAVLGRLGDWCHEFAEKISCEVTYPWTSAPPLYDGCYDADGAATPREAQYLGCRLKPELKNDRGI